MMPNPIISDSISARAPRVAEVAAIGDEYGPAASAIATQQEMLAMHSNTVSVLVESCSSTRGGGALM